ncbi:MAG TPA: carbohydrate-binding family 9-like protein [Chitinophagaceae bacterium]
MINYLKILFNSGAYLLIAVLLLGSIEGRAQVSFKGLESLFTVPKGYSAPFTRKAPVIDGAIDEAVWQQAPWTESFVDIEGKGKPLPYWDTRVKMLWNDTCLFIAARMEEPHVWGTLTNRDDIIYYDNDFEVFLDPDNDTHHYFEVEVNALNTVLDLFMAKPYRNGVGALIGYDMAGLRSAVKVQGTLNDPMDKDSSWTVELAIPFRSIFMGNRWRAPHEGELWRINFSRVQWEVELNDGAYRVKKDEKGARLPERNWVWSPQGVINMHYPERWGYLQFTRKSEAGAPFKLPYEEARKQYLWLVYYRQKKYLSEHRTYASSLKDLGFTTPHVTVEGKPNQLKLERTSRQFSVSIEDGQKVWILNEEGQVQQKVKTL